MSNGYEYQKSGKATKFGGLDDLEKFKKLKAQGYTDQEAFNAGADNGIGVGALGGVKTTYSYGAAVPRSELEKQFGPIWNSDGTINETNAAKARAARADVTWNGQTVRLPIVDRGPGEDLYQQHNKVTDLTEATHKAWGSPDPAKVVIHVVPDAGPDYNADKDKWYEEQNQIHSQLTTKTGVPSIGQETNANPTPLSVQLGGPALVKPVPKAQPVAPPAPAPTSASAPRAQPVQSFAKGGFVQPIDVDDDLSDPMYQWPEH